MAICKMKLKVEVKDPLKQGLKHSKTAGNTFGQTEVEVKDPLKQGLKLLLKLVQPLLNHWLK